MTQSQAEEIKEVFATKSLEEQKLFIDDYVDVRQKITDTDKDGNNILHFAAEDCCLEVFDYILQKPNADLLYDEYNTKGMDPISCALAFGWDLEIIRKYTDGFGEDDFLDLNGNTPLHLAAAYNPHKKITEYLLSSGYFIHHTNKAGLTPVEMALANQQNPEVVGLILDAEKTNVMESVLENSNPYVLQNLKNRGYDLNAELMEGKRPILLAAMNNPDPNFFFTLLNLGALIEARDWYGRNVIHYAAKNKSPKLYKILTDDEFLKNNAEYNLFCEDLYGHKPDYYLANETDSVF